MDAAWWPDLLAYTEDRAVYGHPARVVVTYNPALWEGQVRGFRHQQLQIEAGLRALQDRLAWWRQDPTPRGRRPTLAHVHAHVRRLLGHKEPGPYLRWTCTADADDRVTLATEWDTAAIAAFQDVHFGKTLLFTDHRDWTQNQIVAAYRGQGSLENAFRPVFHWTDAKIRIHATYCVWALLLASLLHREAQAAGFTAGYGHLLEALIGLKLVVDFPTPGRREPARLRVTERTPEQAMLYERFGLADY